MTDETPPGEPDADPHGGLRYEAAVMLEYPFVALAHSRTEELRFPDASGKITLVVKTDGTKGMAFVSDLNVLIWVITELHERVNVRDEHRDDIVLSIARSKLLRYIGKQPGGPQHKDLVETLERLHATRVETNLPSKVTRGELHSFKLLERCDVDDTDPTDPVWTLTPSDWLIDIVQKKHIKPINPDSMKLHGIERCVYRYARATVGDDSSRQVHLDPARAADRFGLTGKGAVSMMRFRLKRMVEKLASAEALQSGKATPDDTRPPGGKGRAPKKKRPPIIPDYTVTASATDGITIQQAGTIFA